MSANGVDDEEVAVVPLGFGDATASAAAVAAAGGVFDVVVASEVLHWTGEVNVTHSEGPTNQALHQRPSHERPASSSLRFNSTSPSSPSPPSPPSPSSLTPLLAAGAGGSPLFEDDTTALLLETMLDGKLLRPNGLFFITWKSRDIGREVRELEGGGGRGGGSDSTSNAPPPPLFRRLRAPRDSCALLPAATCCCLAANTHLPPTT